MFTFDVKFSSKNITSPVMLDILPMMLRATALRARLTLGEKKEEANLVFSACTEWNNVPLSFMSWYM